MCKLSIIIPVYNTEKYLPRCLNSVLSQSLVDIEVICIDDCSKDNSGGILRKYALKDNRIKIITLDENKGPAFARNLGIEKTNGEYIAFLDSDDYPESTEFYEKLYNKAQETNSDIVKGLYKNSDGSYFEDNIEINAKIKEEKTNFCATFCSGIYKRDFLLQNNILFPDLRDMEDPVFSFKCGLQSNNIEVIDDLFVVITKRDDSLTANEPTFEQIKDKITGLNILLELANNSKSISKQSYAYVLANWFNVVIFDSVKNKCQSACNYLTVELCKIYKQIKYKTEFSIALNFFSHEIYEYFETNKDIYFTNKSQLKKLIDSHSVISFDIFDTLLVRPFLVPTDLFVYLEDVEKAKDFALTRIMTEKKARIRAELKNHYEDVNYDEIYNSMPEQYQYLKQKELDLEFNSLKADLDMQEIYNYALSKNKKIIITSDMYLKKDFLVKVLEKNGYKNFSKIYVSGEERRTKGSGNLFRVVINDLKLNPCEILHIGDNIESDFNRPKELGIDSFHHLSNAFVFFRSLLNFRNKKYQKKYNFVSTNKSIALQVCNQYNPKNQSYWYNFGYSIGGILVLAFALAIKSLVDKRKFSDVFFIARDSYPVKWAYDYIGADAKSHYVYAQRRIKEQCFPKEENPYYNENVEREYKKYMESIDLKGDKILLTDSCTGAFTAQSLIEKYLAKSCTAVYLVTNMNFEHDYITLFYDNCGTCDFNWNLAELVLTSPEATVVSIKDNMPVYEENPNPNEVLRQKIYTKIFEGEKDFVENYIKTHGKNINEAEVVKMLECAYNNMSFYWNNLDSTDRFMLSKIKHPMDINSKKYLSMLIDPCVKANITGKVL